MFSNNSAKKMLLELILLKKKLIIHKRIAGLCHSMIEIKWLSVCSKRYKKNTRTDMTGRKRYPLRTVQENNNLTILTKGISINQNLS